MPAPSFASGARCVAKSLSRPSAGRSRNSAPNPTTRSALSSRGRGRRPSPKAALQARAAAEASIGAQATCRSPVCAAISPIAARSDGLVTGPVSRTTPSRSARSRATTSAPTAGHELATVALLPRRTEIGPCARSGS